MAEGRQDNLCVVLPVASETLASAYVAGPAEHGAGAMANPTRHHSCGPRRAHACGFSCVPHAIAVLTTAGTWWRVEHRRRIFPAPSSISMRILHGLGLCPLLQDLELHRYGFSSVEPHRAAGGVFRDGTGIVISRPRQDLRFAGAVFQAGHRAFRGSGIPIARRSSVFVSLLYNTPFPRGDPLTTERAKGKELLSHAQHDLSASCASISSMSGSARCSHLICM